MITDEKPRIAQCPYCFDGTVSYCKETDKFYCDNIRCSKQVGINKRG